jgi:serine/threonine protein kinase
MAIKEFQTLSELNHCNIIKPSHLLIDSLVCKAFMFMPILTENTLSDVLASREEALMECEVLGIARQVVSALAHVHSKSVIHRDINPNNVIYADGKAVLIDFQTCTRLDSTKWMMSEVGTGAYTAPEMKTSTVYK